MVRMIRFKKGLRMFGQYEAGRGEEKRNSG
jgi:hypothetical protein